MRINSWCTESGFEKKMKQKIFVKHVCPPYLKCHCDLDLWPRNPKFSRGSFTSHDQPLYQVRRSLGDEFCSYWLDKICHGLTDRLIDMCKAIYSHFFKGGHNYKILTYMRASWCAIYLWDDVLTQSLCICLASVVSWLKVDTHVK